MLSYIGRRILQAIPLLIGVSIIGFALMHLAPGGPLAVYTLNPTITAQDIERIKVIFGLDPRVSTSTMPKAGVESNTRTKRGSFDAGWSWTPWASGVALNSQTP